MKHMDEKLNVRCFYLKLMDRAWVCLLLSAAFAAAALAVYLFFTVFIRPQTYTAEASLYLYYVENATNDEVYYYYNAYTWNEIAHTDEVVNEILARMEDEDFINGELSDDERQWLAQHTGDENYFGESALENSMSVSLPSDIRLMQLDVTDEDELYVQVLLKASVRGLISYAEKSEVLRSIEIMSMKDASPTVYPDIRLTVMLCGAVIGFIFSVFYLWVRFLISDAIYVPEEAERRYALPVIGVMAPAGVDVAQLPEIFINEYRMNMNALLQKGSRLRILTDLSKEGGDKIKVELESLQDKVRRTCETAGVQTPRILVKGISKNSARVISIGSNAETEKAKDSDGEKDIILIAVRAGVEQGVLIEHLIAQLKAHGEEASGLLFMSKDLKFLKRYYRL